jgi:uncharacterized protein (DUF433 family)
MYMQRLELLRRVSVDPKVSGGKPCVRGTRIQHYPQLTAEDIRAALAYAGELAQENTWKLAQ